MTRFRILQAGRLPLDTRICDPDEGRPARVSMESPARDVMTDLRRTRAVTIGPDATIDNALQRMIHAGVRLLLVTDEDDRVTGLITARDVMGEKPVRVASEERIPRDAVRVGQIMVPQGHIQVLDLGEVERSTVGDVVLTLREAGRQHALVLEPGEPPMIRGIFSVSQIGRQLGVEIEATGVLQSFAELEHLLGAS